VLVPRVVPYCLPDERRDRTETQRATTPLLHGPLPRSPRPWEARFKDSLHAPRCGWPPHLYVPQPPVVDRLPVEVVGSAEIGDAGGPRAGSP
jgi:hypothetical protein